MNVFLVGLRGAGKSSLGRDLASRRAMTYVDLDTWTAAAAATDSPGKALASLGEPAFRRAEACALRVVLSYRRQVVALGGGTPTAPGAERLIQDARSVRHIRVIYLRAQPAALRARLAKSNLTERPSITGEGTLEEIDTLFAQRDPLYQRIADVVIDTDGLSHEQAFHALLEACPDPLPALAE
ncbi:shikimate kinase [Phycisphaerales bacterium]|nr:shikimate kinase [Phycisphaerales bacterium]